MRRPFLPALAALIGLLSGVLVAVGTAGPAAADEVAERPADGVFAIEGHGWGHGRGMSQHGAQGAATLGRTADEITSFYYPGTTRMVLAPAPIRVLLQGDDGRDLQVHPAAGLKVTDVATGTTQELPAGPSRWRVTVDAAGLHVQSLTGSTWSPYALGGGTTSAGPIRFSGPTFVRVDFPNATSRDYRGAVQAVKTSSTGLASVVVLPLEDYLLGVVPRESVSSWKPAALQAQAIAARSYSANKRDRVNGAGNWDICDTTQCQVFGGSRLHTASGVTDLEPVSTSEAVRATAGVVRAYGGKAIFAEYSSSNGGWSTAGDFPYLTAQRDDWDGAVPNHVHSWKASLRAADLERRFPAVGTLKRIRVTARDGNGEWGGRVKTVVLEGVSSTGAATSVTTTGAGVYNARTWPANSDGLKSSWWRVVPTEPTSTTGAVLAGTAVGAAVAAPGSGPATSGGPSPVFADGRTIVVPRAGRTVVRMSLRNDGDGAWPAGSTSPIWLGTSAPRNRVSSAAGSDWWTTSRATRLQAGTASVAPGQTGTFDLTLHGNGHPVGITPEAFEPLWTGHGWIEGAPRSLYVVRVDPAVSRLAMVHAAPPAAVALRNDETGRTELVVRLRNLGGSPWTLGTERLGTAGDAAYALSTPAWASPSRPPALSLNANRPGSSTVHPGEIGEWRIPLAATGKPAGTYRLVLQAVNGTTRYGPQVATDVTVSGTTTPRPAVERRRPLWKGSGPRYVGRG